MFFVIVIWLSILIFYYDSVGCMVGFYLLVISVFRYKFVMEFICVRVREDYVDFSMVIFVLWL